MLRLFRVLFPFALFLVACNQPTPTPTTAAKVNAFALPDHTIRRSLTTPLPQAPAGLNQCLDFADVDENGKASFPDKPNNEIVSLGRQFTKYWQVKNNCKASTKGWYAVKTGGEVKGPNRFDIGEIAPGSVKPIHQDFTAPAGVEPGVYTALYDVVTSEGNWTSGLWVDVGVQ